MKNNGIISTGKGNVIVNGAVIGDPNGDSPDANNGVIATGDGDVVITNTVIGSGNTAGGRHSGRR